MVRYELYCIYHYFKSKTTIKKQYFVDFIADFCVTFNKKDPAIWEVAESTPKNDKGEIKSEKSKALSAQMKFLSIIEVGESYDYRCLKPKRNLQPNKWPYYHMPEFRAAKNKAELRKVEEVPFDKYFFNMADPEVFKAMTEPIHGPKLWKKTYGMDFADFLPNIVHLGTPFRIFAGSQKIYQNCLEAEYGKFAHDCKQKKGFFKCCMQV